MSVTRIIENILFASDSPCTAEKLAKISQQKTEDVQGALEQLMNEFSADRGGIVLIAHDGQYSFATNPDATAIIASMRKEDQLGELTRPALETLSVIAYRAPITKPEIEQIRGVNCSISLRNLLMAGLIEEVDHESGERAYTVSMDFMRHLGVASPQTLPDYERLNTLLVADRNQEAEPVSLDM